MACDREIPNDLNVFIPYHLLCLCSLLLLAAGLWCGVWITMNSHRR